MLYIDFHSLLSRVEADLLSLFKALQAIRSDIFLIRIAKYPDFKLYKYCQAAIMQFYCYLLPAQLKHI
jgi:hypothetical protein